MRVRVLALALLLGFGTLGLAACEEKGPAERAGEKIDNAAEKVGDAINPKGPAEKTGEKIDDALKR